MPPLKIQGKIDNIEYHPTGGTELQTVVFQDFDINNYTSRLIRFERHPNHVAISRWKGPKRTRTYPFANIYDTYSFNGKRITVIPIIKDEGSDTNNDRINFITLSWMNLLNVYIILAWYEDADKKSPTRITNQILNNDWVKEKIFEINDFQLDAHHWNNRHFINEFAKVLQQAVQSYIRISRENDVLLHSYTDHFSNYIDHFYEDDSEQKISLEKFAEFSLKRSRLAASRETQTIHNLEVLQEGSVKALFELENNLGGKYFLTSDDVFINKERVIIQEAKNSSRSPMPGLTDIKDGVFKIILFSNLREVIVGDMSLPVQVRLRLTGNNIQGKIELPEREETINRFVRSNLLSGANVNKISWLNNEASRNNFQILIESA